MTDLRLAFCTGTPRRTTIAASVTDPAWSGTVAARPDGPYFFVAEAVLPFLDEDDVHHVVGPLAEGLPGSVPALDTAGPGVVGAQDAHDTLSKAEARVRWNCADPADLALRHPGTRVLASCRITEPPPPVHDRLPSSYRDVLSGLAAQHSPRVDDHRLTCSGSRGAVPSRAGERSAPGGAVRSHGSSAPRAADAPARPPPRPSGMPAGRREMVRRACKFLTAG